MKPSAAVVGRKREFLNPRGATTFALAEVVWFGSFCNVCVPIVPLEIFKSPTSLPKDLLSCSFTWKK